MQGPWITLYDVGRDGIGLAPWVFVTVWLGAIVAVTIAIRKTPVARLFLCLWLFLWVSLGGFGLGNVFYQYAANYRALKSGTCAVVEGPITNFHRQVPFRKGDSERLVVNGQSFRYDADNFGGGGLRSSANFSVPLQDNLYVRVCHRHGIICRLEALVKKK